MAKQKENKETPQKRKKKKRMEATYQIYREEMKNMRTRIMGGDVSYISPQSPHMFFL